MSILDWDLGFMINFDFNEFLRVMSCILIMLLIVQGLDYIFGFGVNNYVFIIFCIIFAFVMGSIYYNVLLSRQREINHEFNVMVHDVLMSIKNDGLNDDNIEVLEELLSSKDNDGL